MTIGRLKRLEQMSPYQQLEFIRLSCLSLASAIQNYQNSTLTMPSDRYEVVDFLNVDGLAISDAVAAFKEDLFLEGGER